MKKFISFISAIMLVITFGVVLSACGEKPVSIAVKDGTLDTELYVGESLDTSKLVLLVTYDNDKVKEVKYVDNSDEIQISNLDTQTAGQKEITITYNKLETTVTITVEEGTHIPVIEYEVQSFSLPTFITDFESNSQAFNLKNSTYKVGDDNAFLLKPTIMGYEIVDGVRGQLTALSYVPATYKVEQKVDGEYTELLNENLTNVVQIDGQNFGFDFSDSAVGNTYKVTVTAQTLSGPSSISHEFEVVDGYNIQSKEMLAVIDNNALTQDDWAELKTQNNIPNVDPDAVVIHGSYDVTNADFPKDYFYYEGDNDLGDKVPEARGTLRNWKSLYSHDTKAGKTYTIYGNYNTIDASAIAFTPIDLIIANTGDTQPGGHSSLISFGGDNDDKPGTEQGNVHICDLSLVGNANRNENEASKGGLVMFITSSEDTHIENVVANSWFTNLIAIPNATGWENSTHVDNVKFTDSFSNMFYYYGIKNNYITDSTCLESGGPIFTLTHVDPAKNTDSRFSNMTIQNSHLETAVQGTEAWFVVNNASSVATNIFALNQLFEGTSAAALQAGAITQGKTFLKNNKANFVGLILSSGDPIANTNVIKGEIIFKNAEGETTYTYSMTNQVLSATVGMIDQVAPGASSKLPFFMGGNQLATVIADAATQKPTGLGWLPLAGNEIYKPGQDETANQKLADFMSGDYMGIYLNGIPSLGAVIQYYDM